MFRGSNGYNLPPRNAPEPAAPGVGSEREARARDEEVGGVLRGSGGYNLPPGNEPEPAGSGGEAEHSGGGVLRAGDEEAAEVFRGSARRA